MKRLLRVLSGAAALAGALGAATSVTISGLARGTTNYWQVRAVNATGTTEANAGVWWRFTTR